MPNALAYVMAQALCRTSQRAAYSTVALEQNNNNNEQSITRSAGRRLSMSLKFYCLGKVQVQEGRVYCQAGRLTASKCQSHLT